jgi:hypothetical protein
MVCKLINLYPDVLTKLDAYAKKEYGGNRTLTINKILEKWLEQNG